MKYITIALHPVEPVLAAARKRYAALKRSNNLPIDRTTNAPYKGERLKDYYHQLADGMAMVGETLDIVHNRFLEMFRKEENINIEVELIGRTKNKDNYSYGVELVFDDTYFIMGYQDKEKTQPVYERIDGEYYLEQKDCPDGDKVGMLKRLTLSRKIRAILDKNELSYEIG